MKASWTICAWLVAACLPLSALDDKSVVVHSSSVANGIVKLRGQVSGKDAEFICFARGSLCSPLPTGEYVMAIASGDEGTVNDCTNVVLSKVVSSGEKTRVGVYCWVNSGDSYTDIATSYAASEMYSRMAKAHVYEAKGFHALDCFAGQVRIRGKRLLYQPFTVSRPNEETKCCGELVSRGRTDSHGHFVVEPLAEGEYFARFDSKGAEYTASFAVLRDYNKCGAAFVELNFSSANQYTLQTFVEVDGDERDCLEDDPACYRK